MKVAWGLVGCFLAGVGGLFGGGCATESPAGGGGGAGFGTGGKGSGGGSGGLGASGTGGGFTSGGASGTGGMIASGGAVATGGVNSGGNSVHTGGAGTGAGGAMSRGGSGAGGALTASTGGTGGSGAGGMATVLSICPGGPYAAPPLSGLVPARVAAVPPSDSFNNNHINFGIIEGPVWIGNALYVSELGIPDNIHPPASRTLKVDSAGIVSIVLPPEKSGTNGMAVDAAGNLVAGNHRVGSITRFALPGFAATEIVSSYNGVRFNAPNDLTFRADGNLYFTDPDWQASTPRPQTKTRIYRVAPGSTGATVVDETRTEANGITLSPDGNTMYVTGADGLFRYAVAPNGTVGTGTKIVPAILVGDGMAIDCAGNLYVAANDANSLIVLDPNGSVLGTITVAEAMAVTNAAFGGADHKTLYITTLGIGAQNGLFTVSMNVPGFPY